MRDRPRLGHWGRLGGPVLPWPRHERSAVASAPAVASIPRLNRCVPDTVEDPELARHLFTVATIPAQNGRLRRSMVC